MSTTGPAEGFRISAQQRHAWLLEREAGGRPLGAHGVVRLDGAADPGLLSAAAGRVLARHEILRARFRRIAGMQLPVQVVDESEGPALCVESLDPAGLDARFEEEVRRPWNLESGPAVRLTLLRMGESGDALL